MILAGVVLGLAAMLFVFQKMQTSQDGGAVIVYQGKERIAAYPLSEERREIIPSSDGGSNTLVIENGEVYIEDADCPDGLCMKQGRISKNGQALVCLPHKLSVAIECGQEAALDGVSG